MSYSVYERHKYAEGVKAADKVISRLVTFGFRTAKFKRLLDHINFGQIIIFANNLESDQDYLICIRIVWHSWYIYSWKAVDLKIEIPCWLKSRQCRMFVILSVPNSQIVINIQSTDSNAGLFLIDAHDDCDKIINLIAGIKYFMPPIMTMAALSVSPVRPSVCNTNDIRSLSRKVWSDFYETCLVVPSCFLQVP